MQKAFDAYPEIVFLDATHKLNNLKLPLFIMLVEDGNGESCVAGLFFCQDEERDTIREMINIFKVNNPNWTKIRTIMADKDMKERDVMLEEIPQAKLLLCKYHTQRTFKREVTTEKMGIDTDSCEFCLEKLSKMVWSRSEEDYERHHKELTTSGWLLKYKFFLFLQIQVSNGRVSAKSGKSGKSQGIYLLFPLKSQGKFRKK